MKILLLEDDRKLAGLVRRGLEARGFAVDYCSDGDDAFAHTAGALDGRLVWLTFDAECLDVYDRTLAYVFRDSDEAGFFNRSLLRGGYGTTLTIEPNDTYAELFAADSRAARDEDAGLWAACDR